MALVTDRFEANEAILDLGLQALSPCHLHLVIHTT